MPAVELAKEVRAVLPPVKVDLAAPVVAEETDRTLASEGDRLNLIRAGGTGLAALAAIGATVVAARAASAGGVRAADGEAKAGGEARVEAEARPEPSPRTGPPVDGPAPDGGGLFGWLHRKKAGQVEEPRVDRSVLERLVIQQATSGLTPGGADAKEDNRIMRAKLQAMLDATGKAKEGFAGQVAAIAQQGLNTPSNPYQEWYHLQGYLTALKGVASGTSAEDATAKLLEENVVDKGFGSENPGFTKSEAWGWKTATTYLQDQLGLARDVLGSPKSGADKGVQALARVAADRTHGGDYTGYYYAKATGLGLGELLAGSSPTEAVAKMAKDALGTDWSKCEYPEANGHLTGALSSIYDLLQANGGDPTLANLAAKGIEYGSAAKETAFQNMKATLTSIQQLAQG